MTMIARRIIATPARSAAETWATIVNLLAPQTDSAARADLLAVGGIAASLIADEAMKEVPIVVYGSGPRVRLYCLYDDDAIAGDNANENALSFVPTDGDWAVSLPCSADDLSWVQASLKKRTSRITARDLTTDVEPDTSGSDATAKAADIDREAFFRP